jgi:hypothetical protein
MNDSLQRFGALTQELQLVPGDDGKLHHQRFGPVDGRAVLPTLWRGTGALQALAKLMAGGAGVWVAIAMARPPKPKLDL